LAPVGDCLVLAEFAADPGIGRFRKLDLFMIESGGQRFRLDPEHRLASFRAKHFGLPPD